MLAPLSQVTHTATQNGSWSSPQTWGGAIPQQAGRVRIPAGITVTLDTCAYSVMFWIRVEGVLRYSASADTCIVAESVFVFHGGKLQIGTAAEPITDRATLTIRSLSEAPIDHLYDPLEQSRGLVVEGLLETHGQPKTAWIPIPVFPAIGATVVVPGFVPDGWQVGDTLALTSPFYGQVETVTLTQPPNSQAISFSPPLKFARPFPAACKALPCTLHLANLTRNVLIRTHPESAGNPALQGHVMLMHQGGHRISYAQFSDLGRTTIDPVSDPLVGEDGTRDPSLMPNCGLTKENVRGRYSLHFHRAGPFSALSIVEGSVVTVKQNGGFKIGMENHSSNVSFRNNVGIYIDGSTFQSEEGDEVGDFTGNLAIHSMGSGETNDGSPSIECSEAKYNLIHHRRRADLGHRGHGFWIHGGGVDVVGNVAAGHGSTGYEFWSRPLNALLKNTYTVEFPVALAKEGGVWAAPKTMIGVEQNPGIWRNNVAYVTGNHKAARQAALSIHYHGLHQAEVFPKSPHNLIDGFFGWGILNGLVTSYAGWFNFTNVTFASKTLIGREEGGRGMGLATQGGNHYNLTNVKIVGPFNSGIVWGAASTASNVTFNGVPLTPPPPPSPR